MDNQDTLNEMNRLNSMSLTELKAELYNCNKKVIIVGDETISLKLASALKKKPTSVICSNDMVDFSTIDTLMEANTDMAIFLNTDKISLKLLNELENIDVHIEDLSCNIKSLYYVDEIKQHKIQQKESISQIGVTSTKNTYAKQQRRNVYAKNFYKK